MERKDIKRIAIVLLLFFLLLSACQPIGKNNDAQNEQKHMITIATGGTTGPYFAIANKMAMIFDRNIPDVSTSVRSSGGGVENIQLILEGKAELGFVMSDIASLAYLGSLDKTGNEKGKELRAITALYPNYIHIITLEESGIKTVDDLKGKKVGVGDIGSGTEVNARTILQFHGLSYEDIEEHYLSYKESVIDLRNGQVDAAFLTSGLPNAMILELVQTHHVIFLPISEEKVNEIAALFPYYESRSIPEGTYLNDKPVATASVTNLLLTRADISDSLIYDITKTIFENIDSLNEAHLAARDIHLEMAKKGLTVPLHPGAEKYYKEHRIH